MKTSTTAICLIASGFLVSQGPLLAQRGGAAHAGGGGFGGGGFHGGSIGNAGHVIKRPYFPGGAYGYAYPMGSTEFAGDQDLSSGDFGASSGAPTAYTGTGGGPPPAPLQDGTGVYVPPPGPGATPGASWDNDWWGQDPRAVEDPAAGGVADQGIGTAVASLPRGSDTVYASSDLYYFAEGIFYQAADSGYQIVAPPIGIEVKQLPNAAEMVKVDSQQYFVYNNTYYQALYGGSGVIYRVVEDPNSQG